MKPLFVVRCEQSEILRTMQLQASGIRLSHELGEEPNEASASVLADAIELGDKELAACRGCNWGEVLKTTVGSCALMSSVAMDQLHALGAYTGD